MKNTIKHKEVVILCVGTPSVVGDSLGPRVGDILIRDYNINAFVYGNTTRPVTGANFKNYALHLNRHHKDCIVIAIDACLGDKKEVGKVKYTLKGLQAGAALNKNLDKIGDVAILGIVAAKSDNNFLSLVDAKQNLVEYLSEKIAKKVFSLTKLICC